MPLLLNLLLIDLFYCYCKTVTGVTIPIDIQFSVNNVHLQKTTPKKEPLMLN